MAALEGLLDSSVAALELEGKDAHDVELEGKDAHHVEFWASVATGLELDAQVEVERLVAPSRAVRTVPGQVLFAVAAARPYEEVAAALKALRTVDYVFAKVASCGLTDAAAGPGGDRGLRSIDEAAAASGARLARGVALWRAFEDGRDAPTSFRCRGKRGGRHAFGSDDAKRAAFSGLKRARPDWEGSTAAFDLDVLVQVHDNRCWIGLKLNDAPLCDDGRGSRAAGLKLRHTRARDARPARPASRLSTLVDGDDAVAPLRGVAYEVQLDAKREALDDVVRDVGGGPGTLEAFDARTSGDCPRNKLDFAVDVATGVVGFKHKAGIASPRGVPFALPWMVRVADALSTLRPKHLSNVVCRGSADGGVVVLAFSTDDGFRVDGVAAVCRDAAAPATLASVCVKARDGALAETLDGGSGGTYDEIVGGLRFRVSATAFFQTNTAGAEILLDAVAEFAAPAAGQKVLDACCGGGALGLAVARRHGAAVSGVELVRAACDDAAHNAAINGLAFDVHCGRLEDALPGILAARDDEGLVVLLDPPRTGLQPSVAKALRREPRVQRIVMVSCNPCGCFYRADFVVKGGSLANVARILSKPGGKTRPFAVTRARPVDLFPHTVHCELVLCFDRTQAPVAS